MNTFKINYTFSKNYQFKKIQIAHHNNRKSKNAFFYITNVKFQEVNIMTSSNKKVVPAAADALNKFKYEVASEVGVNLKDGYNGDISSRDAGRIGGNMVRKLIQQAESNMTK